MLVKCAHCGTHATNPQFFVEEEASFRVKTRKVCPACWRRRKESALLNLLIFQGLIWSAGVWLVIRQPSLPVGWLILNFALFQIGSYLSILPHELGHFAAAKLLGMRPLRMFIGSGPTLLSGIFLNVPTEFKAFPISGAVRVVEITNKWFRSKRLLLAAAGPMANALIAFVIWSFGDQKLASVQELATGLNPVKMLFFANVVLCIGNLFPMSINTHAGNIPSDGMQILRAPFLTKSQIERMIGTSRQKRGRAKGLNKLV